MLWVFIGINTVNNIGGGGDSLVIALPHHEVTDHKVFLLCLSFDEAKIICFIPVM